MTSGVADSETTTYLGFRIDVHGGHLTIYTPAGRLIFTGRMEPSGARRVIRAYRKEAA